MATVAPITQWWDEGENAQQTQWDAGIVDAGSESDVTIFHLWNNRKGSVPVSDMINVDITVRDVNGQMSDLSICGQTDGVVMAQFYDSVKKEWGSIQDGLWVKDSWTELIYSSPKPVVSVSGVSRTISGSANSGNVSEDTSNFAAIKLKLYAKPTATAGRISWLTRISYQYQ